jgi:hypothetical protein
VEGVDSVMMHEIVLGGHLYLQLLKEKLEVFLQVRLPRVFCPAGFYSKNQVSQGTFILSYETSIILDQSYDLGICNGVRFYKAGVVNRVRRIGNSRQEIIFTTFDYVHIQAAIYSGYL